MATFGTLAVNVVANNLVSKGLNSAIRDVKGFSSKLAVAGKTISKAFGVLTGVGIGGGVAGLAVSIRASADELDRMAKISDKLGISAEAMGGLQVAAQRSGVEFKALTTGLQRMTRRLSEAGLADPSKNKVALALREMGLSVQELNQLRPEQALGRIADGMKTVQSQADKVRIAFTLFDTEGVALVNTLSGGSSQLREWAQEAERLGLVFSREELAKVEKFNDAMGQLRNVWGSFSQQLTIAIAPKATEFMEGMMALVQLWPRMWSQWTASTPQWVKDIASLAGTIKQATYDQYAGFVERQVLAAGTQEAGPITAAERSRGREIGDAMRRDEARRAEQQRQRLLEELRQQRNRREALEVFAVDITM